MCRKTARAPRRARNDLEILDAARTVLLADPSAPIAAVASRAGVGISALCRRYPSKEELLRELARDGLIRYIAELEGLWSTTATLDSLCRVPHPDPRGRGPGPGPAPRRRPHAHAGPGRTCAARSQAGPGASPDCPAPGGAAQGRALERHPPSRVTERHRTAWRQQRVTRCAAATSLCFFRHCVPQAPRRSPDVPPTQPRSRHAGGPSADAHTRAMTPPTFSGISPSDHRCRSSKKYTEELVGLDAADLTEADTIGHCPSLRDLVEQKKTDAPSTVLAIMTLARCLRCRSSGDRCSVGPDGSRRARDRRSRTPEAGCRQ